MTSDFGLGFFGTCPPLVGGIDLKSLSFVPDRSFSEEAESIQNPKLVDRDYVFLLEIKGKIKYGFGALLSWLSGLSMQNTRLNNLVNVVLAQLGQWFANPWRRFSLVLISLLLGFFLGSAIPTTAGQSANWDVIAAGILLVFTEVVSRIVYGSNQRRPQLTAGSPKRSLLAEVVNALKIGVTYSLFVEAFKLGS